MAYALGFPVERGRERYLSTLARNLYYMNALDGALDAFAAARVPVQPLKGALLVETLYDGDLGVRAMSDLDLLVRPDTLQRASRALLDLGYRQVGVGQIRYAPDMTHHLVFVRLGVVIELHYRLTSALGVDGDGELFFREARPIVFRDRTLHVARDELQLYFTLLHAATHGFVHHRAWVVDARLQASTMPALDLGYLLEIARSRNTLRMVRTAARMVNSFFPNTFHFAARAEGIRERALDGLLARTRRMRSPSLRSITTYALCLERWSDVARYFVGKADLRRRELLEQLRSR